MPDRSPSPLECAMDLSFSPEEEAFRQEVRAFIAEAKPKLPDVGATESADRSKEDYLAWHKLLYKKGWVAPLWPKEYGGTGWNVTQRYIFNEEVANADMPTTLPFGLNDGGAGDLHLRQRRAEKAIPAAHPVRRGLVVPGLFRAGRGLRSCQPAHARGARRRPLHRQRPEDLDHARAVRRLDLLPGAHRYRT